MMAALNEARGTSRPRAPRSGENRDRRPAKDTRQTATHPPPPNCSRAAPLLPVLLSVALPLLLLGADRPATGQQRNREGRASGDHCHIDRDPRRPHLAAS